MRIDEALASYDKAIEIKPEFIDVYCNRGFALKELKRLDEAVASYDRAIEIDPDYEYLLGTLLHTKMHVCDWQDFDANVKNLLLKISEGKKSSPNFPTLALTDSLSIQRKTAEIWINDKHPLNPSLGVISKLPKKEKIKLAFLSADFKEHPMGYNFVGFFENIDRDKFEVIAVSFLNITDSPLSRRLAAAFDVFKIVDKLSDTEVCKWILDQKVDIAIDMMGPTLGNRGGIFAMRCAPIQANQFSWTSAAPYIDYIIADPISMPEEYAYGYSEKLAYVPHTLFATDDKREISIKTPLRSEQNLPEKGIVFCCLNNNFKITPHVFDSWINILKNVPDSVLWIKGGHESMERNLCKEMAMRGVDTNRLVFAKHTALMQDHLARYRLADLFLDTFPFCAQTTASDALWAGVPVLTRVGESSMSRICASLLNAIELPELITKTQAEYEARAIELANNPEKLKAIKDKLESNRLTTALFDTPRFTRHMEAAYIQMYERYQSDLPSDHIYIDA
jgi:predicted O-linked N-acetylglucosamine transferase (SPINDLY family)